MARLMRRAVEWLRARPELVVLLALAVTIRLAVAVAYDPALFHYDSWGYLDGAVDFEPLRTSRSATRCCCRCSSCPIRISC